MQKEKKSKKEGFIKKIVRIWKGIPGFFMEILYMIRLVILLFFVFIEFILQTPIKERLNKPMKKIKLDLSILRKPYSYIYLKILKLLDTSTDKDIKTSDLIFLALKNLTAKKNRTYVTIGGMAMGFGAVILLLSLGYGFEKLVISRVTTLSEMRQINVVASQGSPMKFSNDILEKIAELKGVGKVIPMISMVSNVSYNNAVSDVLVTGVDSRYFDEMRIKPFRGKLYSDSDIQLQSKSEDKGGTVSGVSTTLISNEAYMSKVSEIHYSIHPLVWKPVYSLPNSDAEIIGYTKREPGQQSGYEIWGIGACSDNGSQFFDLDGNRFCPWVDSQFLIWEKKACDLKISDCVDKKYLVLREGEHQSIKQGYITTENLSYSSFRVIDKSASQIYMGKMIDSISFKVGDGDYTEAYFNPKSESLISSVIDRSEGSIYKGDLIYGEYYGSKDNLYKQDVNGNKYGIWVKSIMDVWSEHKCEQVCDTYSLFSRDGWEKLNITLYFKAEDILLLDESKKDLYGEVLGEQSVSSDETLGSKDEVYLDIGNLMKEDDTIDWESLASDLGVSEEVSKDIKQLPEKAKKTVVVNTAMLSLLGIEADEAIGVKFKATLIFDSKLFNKDNYTVQSDETEFEIIGAISDSKPSSFYLPINDLVVEGLQNVSQVLIVSDGKDDVEKIRENVESMGFLTSSVIDTVDKISSVFKTLRIILLVLGLIALSVASLGMFNTLTVSLLEKTREVGLLKIMGLKSYQVKTLFLAESIIMSVFGGVSGLLLGFGVGKLLSILISVLAIAQGQQFVDISYIPFVLGFGIVTVSAFVGVLTGYYPSKRATGVSALDALRYE